MDKKIKKIEKEVKELGREDKKRDKVCEYGAKKMKEKKKKK